MQSVGLEYMWVGGKCEFANGRKGRKGGRTKDEDATSGHVEGELDGGESAHQMTRKDRGRNGRNDLCE